MITGQAHRDGPPPNLHALGQERARLEGTLSQLKTASGSADSRHQQARYLTATRVEACLSSSATILSTASTIVPDRPASPSYFGMEEAARSDPRLIAFVEEQRCENAAAIEASRKKESALLWLVLLAPRFVGTLALLAVFLVYGVAVIVIYFFWSLTVLCIGVARFRRQNTKLTQKFGGGFAWFGRCFRAIW